MRKLMLIMVIVFCMVTFVGCSEPSDASKQALSIGNQVIEITDEYLDSKISASEACAQIEKFDGQIDHEVDRKYYDDYFIWSGINSISHSLFMSSYKGGNENYEQVLVRRNALAKTLGKGTRK